MGDRRLIGKVHAIIAVGALMIMVTSKSWIPRGDAALFSSKTKETTCETSNLMDSSNLDDNRTTGSKSVDILHDDFPTIPSPPLLDGQPHNHSIIYVHVGKTGGITLDKVLESNCLWYEAEFKRRQCLQQQHSSSTVSSLTKATLHFGPRQAYNEWIHNATMFLITLRNPISRVVSAFNFDHPSNNPIFATKTLSASNRHFFVVCFPTIQDLATLLDLAEKTNKRLSRKQRTCYESARQILAGTASTSDPSPQLTMNLQFYYQLSIAQYPDRPILVIRTEHLWEDLLNIDRGLGGTGNFDSVGTVYTHGSQSRPVRQGLSPSGKQIMCCYLWREVRLYEEIVRRAINLSPTDKDETMAEVYSQCGVAQKNFSMSSWEGWAKESCPQSTSCN